MRGTWLLYAAGFCHGAAAVALASCLAYRAGVPADVLFGPVGVVPAVVLTVALTGNTLLMLRIHARRRSPGTPAPPETKP